MNSLDNTSSDMASAETRDCPTCGFGLWMPIMGLTESEIGLYSDSRFPGRCIVTLRDHYEQLDDMQPWPLATFMEEIQYCVEALKAATGSPRINVAILGNAESHVHAHLIPRYPEQEALPSKAPWEDPREKHSLPPETAENLIRSIRAALREKLERTSYRPPTALARPKTRKDADQTQPATATLFDMLSSSNSVS